MLSSDDCVVELQHSSLSAVQIQEREAFYGKMVWLLDGTVLQNRLRVESVGNQTEFTWAHERLSWRVARKPIFVHGFSLGRSMKYLNPRSGRLEISWQETIRSSDVLQIKSFARGKHVRGEAKIIPLGHFCEKLFH